mgnify:CR=1 FL=1
MTYFGELISVFVAFSWTLTALFFEFAGKRIGSLIVNIIRLLFAFTLLGAMLFFTTGSFLPLYADSNTWLWLSLSGLVGFVFGDLCLFYSYVLITARFSQLLMTLAPPFAALFGYFLLNERMSYMGIVGMSVTLLGIAISILKRGTAKDGITTSDRRETFVGGVSSMTVITHTFGLDKLRLDLPLKGVLLGIGGALGQGLGIVLSKKGLGYYDLAEGSTSLGSYLPFAATQIRIITGMIGFFIIILLSGKMKSLVSSFKDKKSISAIFGGSIFGPFLGVSLSLMAVQYTNTAVASTIMATTPIIIIIPYIFIYKKKITPIEIFGAILSVIGVSLFFIG